jgi:hypothetical protein
MRFVRLFFGLKYIYLKQTTIRILYLYLVCGALLWLGIEVAMNVDYIPMFVPFLMLWVYFYFLARSILRAWIVRNYLSQYPKSLISMSAGEIGHSSANLELKNFDHLTPISNFGKANLFIATFDFYVRSKYGDYLAEQAYYTVLELPLKRTLPHILFDSRSAKKRQFRHLYLKAQRLSVQGTFDQVFDTYVPQTYNIDSLSFVTPEVMEALVDAKMYDIEIVNSRVLLYAPLLDEDDLKPLVARGEKIAKELNDNIDTYRDDRLTGKQRVTEVTPFAKTLLKSPFKSLVFAFFSTIAMVGIIYIATRASAEDKQTVYFNQFSLLVYILFTMKSIDAIKIMLQNKKAEERFRLLYHTDRGKPIKGK